MKKFTVILILAFVMSSCTQVRFLHAVYGNERNWEVVSRQEVPADVIKTFEKEYPGIAAVKWMKPCNNRYVASFYQNEKITLAVFSASGLLQDEENYEPDDYFLDEEFDEYWEIDIYD